MKPFDFVFLCLSWCCFCYMFSTRILSYFLFCSYVIVFSYLILWFLCNTCFYFYLLSFVAVVDLYYTLFILIFARKLVQNLRWKRLCAKFAQKLFHLIHFEPFQKLLFWFKGNIYFFIRFKKNWHARKKLILLLCEN